MANRSREHSLYQRKEDGLWVAVLELPPKAGKRRRRKIYGSTEAEAIAARAKERRILEERGDLATSSQTVKQWFTYYLTKIAPGALRPKTLSGYRSVINAHVIPAIGNTKLSKLTPDSIREVYDHILSTPKRKSDPDGPKLSHTYCLNAFRIMSRVLTIAEREGKLGRNPCTLMDAPKPNHFEPQALSTDEAKQVLRKAAEALDADGPYDPLPVLWAFYLLTACRKGEGVGLEYDRISTHLDISWQLQRVKDIENVPANYKHRHLEGTFYMVAVKTEAGNRVIPSVDPLKTLLALHSAKMGDGKHGLVFCHIDGTPLDPDTLLVKWEKWLTTSGITDKHVRLHDLRHTTVDLLTEAEVPEEIIRDIVGHSTRMQTRKYRTRRADARMTSAMEALAELLA